MMNKIRLARIYSLLLLILLPPLSVQATEYINENWDSGTLDANWPCQDFPNQPCPDRAFNGWEPDSYTCDESVVTGSQRSSAQSHSGSYSYYQKRESGEYKVCDLWHDISGSPTKIYLRFYIYFTNNWSNFHSGQASESVHLIFTNTAIAFTGFKINLRHHTERIFPYTCPSGMFFWPQDGGTMADFTPTSCYDIQDHLEEWICVEFMMDATNDKFQMWINGDSIYDEASTPITQSGFSRVNISGYDSFGQPYTGDFYIDDIVVSDSYIGTMEPSPPKNLSVVN